MPRVRVKVPKEPKIIEMPYMNGAVSLPTTPVVEAPQPSLQPPVEAEQLASIPEPMETAPEPFPAQPLAPEQAYVPPAAAPAKALTLSPKALAFSGVAMVIIVLFAIGITRTKTEDTTKQTLGATTTEKSEAQKYYDVVSKYVELPADELPTVANVSEADKVRDQNAVLADVKDGDKMLFFAKSRKVVIYRPSSQKVVAVVSLAQPTTAPTPTATPTKSR